MFNPSIGLAIISISKPFPFVAPTSSRLLVIYICNTMHQIGCFVQDYYFLLVNSNICKFKNLFPKSFFIPTSYWSSIEDYGFKSTVVSCI
jgi:hypothetical protein